MVYVYGNVDNCLHKAALAHSPPSGTFYDPEGDGTILNKLDVHETNTNFGNQVRNILTKIKQL